MDYPRQITTIQAAIVLFSTIIGVGVLALSLFAVRSAGTGGPLITLSGIFIASLGLFFITLLGMRFPTKSIIKYSEDVIGKWFARVFSCIIILFFAVLTALAAREFGEVVLTSVLTKTPLEVTVIVMLLLAAIYSRVDITIFAYIHHFYFPVILFPGLIIVFLSLKNANLTNLLPIWGNEHKLIWPTLELAKTTSLPANVLERLDGAFLAVWVIAVFTTIYSTYYLTIHSVNKLFRVGDQKRFSFFVFPFIFVIAMLPQNVLQMYQIIQYVGCWGLVLTVAYPFVLLVVAFIRKKKRGDGNDRHATKLV
jgi:spore germination protein